MNKDEWLTDNLLLVSQKILKEQLVPNIHLRCNYGIFYHEGNFIHDTYGHWFTVSTIGAQAFKEVYL